MVVMYKPQSEEQPHEEADPWHLHSRRYTSERNLSAVISFLSLAPLLRHEGKYEGNVVSIMPVFGWPVLLAGLG